MTTAVEQVIVLDDEARAIGAMEKLAAHRSPGTPHLAFSVLLSDADGRVLLQRRSDAKHHWRGAWANTVCSHPRPGEDLVSACRRRLHEELGLSQAPPLSVAGAFWYVAEDPDSGLVEHEYDVVVVGTLAEAPRLDPRPDEVAEVAWVTPDAARSIAEGPTGAPWLAHVLRTVAAPDPDAVRLPDAIG